MYSGPFSEAQARARYQSSNNQVLLDDGNRIIVPQGNFKFHGGLNPWWFKFQFHLEIFNQHELLDAAFCQSVHLNLVNK